MTTVDSPNVHTVAIEGTFDDCQDLVKAMFNDATFRERNQLSAVNSINWARVMAQTVYYVTASETFAEPVTFSVPTGNFGNVLSGWIARRDGRADPRLHRRVEHQRHPDPLHQRRRHVDPGRGAHLEPIDGHPGVVQLRAPAVRDERSRRRAHRRAARPLPGTGTARARSRPAGGVRRRTLPGCHVRRRRDARRDRQGPRRHRVCCSTRTLPRARRLQRCSPARPTTTGDHARDRPPGQVPRRRRTRDRPSPGACPPTSPTCSNVPNAHRRRQRSRAGRSFVRRSRVTPALRRRRTPGIRPRHVRWCVDTLTDLGSRVALRDPAPTPGHTRWVDATFTLESVDG